MIDRMKFAEQVWDNVVKLRLQLLKSNNVEKLITKILKDQTTEKLRMKFVQDTLEQIRGEKPIQTKKFDIV